MEAIRVANGRGIRSARRRNPLYNHHIGIHGSNLAEYLIVNVLRFEFTDRIPVALLNEVDQFGELDTDYGVAAAREDLGLLRLRALISRAPRFSELISRIFVWYDYACMPQVPRSEQEQRQFELGLRCLGECQALGKNIILLDDPFDYLTRAWCTQEATYADSVLNHPVDLLIGGHAGELDDEHRVMFFNVLRDRPHLIWRGVLDTEVFRVQTPQQCMRRLGLATTRAEDLDLVYEMLCGMGAPEAIHTDDSELLTGFFPVPCIGSSAMVAKSGGAMFRESRGPLIDEDVDDVKVFNLDLTASTKVDRKRLAELRAEDVLPLITIGNPQQGDRGAGVRVCHVTVMASCEAEAIVFARFVNDRRQAIAALLGVSICSLSWLASDVAPVGVLLVGDLDIAPIEADVWVTIASLARLQACSTTRLLENSARLAGIEYVTIAIDRADRNVVRFPSAPERAVAAAVERAAVDTQAFARYRGGLFRRQLYNVLGSG